MPPSASGELLAPQPVAPERAYSFTDWQVNNPAAPPPGDKLDSEIDNTNNALADTIDWAATSLNTDGTLASGTVGETQLVPGLFDEIAADAVAEVQPLVDQASSYATQALGSATAASTSAVNAGDSATTAGNFAATASTAAVTAQGASTSAVGSADAASAAANDAADSANDASGSTAVAQAYADVGMAWAEHMPDTIPPNILAVMGVTGDHWSSRWWANKAATVATGALNYRGVWNPVTNTPVLATGGLSGGVASKKADYYVASATGTSVPIDGQTAWTSGDMAVSTGTAWQRVALDFTGSLIYTATGGNTPRDARDRAADVTNVLDYGADPTGVLDSAPAFQAALARGKSVYAPAGTYRITRQLVVGANQTLFGDSRASTTLNISTDFSQTDTGVISLIGRERAAPVLRDFLIVFNQTTTQTSRAAFLTLAAGGDLTTGIKYPPAVILTTANRFRILNVSIYGAWDGIINAPGNTIGGYIIDNVEMGALDCGLWLDNQFDFGHLKSYHFWNFGFTGAVVTSVFEDGNTFAAKFGKNGPCQACMIEDFSTFEGQVSIDDTGSWLHFANLGLDGSAASFTVNNCIWVHIVNVYTSAGPAAPHIPFSLAGAGTVMVNTMFGGAYFSLTGTGNLILDNIYPNAQQTTIPLISQTAGALHVKDSVLWAPVGFGAWTTVPLIQCTGGITVLVDNVLTPAPGGTTRPGISITNDNAQNVVHGNLLNGWAWTPPGTSGFYGLNSDMITPKGIQAELFTAQTQALASVSFRLNAAAGNQRAITSYSSSLLRWAIIPGTLTAETGGNVGSDFLVSRYDDTGIIIDTPITITRSTGRVTIPTLVPLSFGLNANPVTRRTVTGSRGGNAALASLLTALAAFGLITDSTTA